MEQKPEDQQRDESQEYEKWARSEEKLWGKMHRHPAFWLVALAVFFFVLVVLDVPKHFPLFQ